ncbi:tRNA lysidine(34) synthetase TilS [Sphingomonas koreensis]|nr:tRNA lysidine(34) synthetase TilS [Sphingomonas koreensis]
MAMLALAAAAFPGQVIAATVDHGLRAEAAGEAAMVGEVCAALDVPHTTLTTDEPIAGASLQAQARRIRYGLLSDWARANAATLLATAHQADDQAETFLMRAARGAGLSGLAGVRAARLIDDADAPILLVRPLLEWRRAELRAIVRRAGLPFVDDPANDDARHDRTRFRRLLGDNEWLDPPRLARAASHLADADADLRHVADWLWDRRRTVGGAAVRIDMSGAPRGIRRRLAARAIGAVRRAGGITAPDWSAEANIEPLLDALDRGKAATHAGVLVRHEGETWLFKPAPPRRIR